jgi:hypothetical protein
MIPCLFSIIAACLLLFISLPFLCNEKGSLRWRKPLSINLLGFDYVNRLKTLRAFFGIKADTVTFGKTLKATALNGRMMDKNIIVVFTGDEAKTFAVVEPLNRSLFHSLSLLIRKLKSQKNSIKKASKLKVFEAFCERKNF